MNWLLELQNLIFETPYEKDRRSKMGRKRESGRTPRCILDIDEELRTLTIDQQSKRHSIRVEAKCQRCKKPTSFGYKNTQQTISKILEEDVKLKNQQKVQEKQFIMVEVREFDLSFRLQQFHKQMVLFPRKKRYSKIPFEKRLQLIKLVIDQHMLIYKAAKRLRIKLPTAKVILTNYRRDGHIFQRKEEEAPISSGAQAVVKEEGSEVSENPPQENLEVPMAPVFYYLPYPLVYPHY